VSVERDVQAARKIRLDARRQEGALRRVRAAREVAAFHENSARAERAKIDVLIRTWDLCPRARALRIPSVDNCCQNPDNCTLTDALPAGSMEP
jgi:hypothetical protein